MSLQAMSIKIIKNTKNFITYTQRNFFSINLFFSLSFLLSKISLKISNHLLNKSERVKFNLSSPSLTTKKNIPWKSSLKHTPRINHRKEKDIKLNSSPLSRKLYFLYFSHLSIKMWREKANFILP